MNALVRCMFLENSTQLLPSSVGQLLKKLPLLRKLEDLQQVEASVCKYRSANEVNFK
jgi:hypothetical protein